MRPTRPAADTTPITTRKRPLWRRVLRVASRVLAGAVVLIAIAIGFLHTSWGKNIVRGVVENKLAAKVNGTVTVGSLDYGFMFSSLSIGKVEIKNAANQPALSIAKIDLVIDRRALLDKDIILDELAITGLDVSSPAIKGLFKKSNSKPLKHVQIKQLHVAGQATLTKPDGSVIAVRELALDGTVDARPAEQTVGVVLSKLGAKVDLPNRHLDIALDGLTLDKRGAVIDIGIAKLAAGAIGIEQLAAHVDRATQHSLTIGKARIDNEQLAQMLGKSVLVDDVALDLSITGPESALVLGGTIKTRDTSLVLSGKADLVAARPTYELAIIGKGKSTDVTAKPKVPRVEGDLRIDIKGTGRPPLDHEAEVTVAIGPTTINAITVDGVEAKAFANRGAYKLERFAAHAAGFDIVASGDLTADKTLSAKLDVTGEPTHALKVLGDAGIAVPRGVPNIGKLALSVTAQGRVDGTLDVQLAPTRITLAGGLLGIRGDARLENKKLQIAHAQVTLAHLDLAGLSRLAGRPPKAQGTVSGTLALTKTATTRDATYDLAIALRDKPLAIAVHGTADLTSAKLRADVRTGQTLLATVDAKLPLDAKGFQPRGAWSLKLDVAKRELAELAQLAGKPLPAGRVEVHVQLAGSPAHPTGTITIAASTKQDIALVATLVPSANGLSVATKGSLAMAGQELALIDGTVAMPYRFIGKKPDIQALRAGLTVDATIDIPERSLASLAMLRPKLATLPGTIGGRVVVKGPLKTPALDAHLAWRGYQTSAGKPGETTIAATGSLAKLAATIDHGPLHITADVDRSNPARVAIHAKMRAAKAAIADVMPAFAATKLDVVEPGSLDWNMDADVVLVKSKLDALAVTGTLDVSGAAIKIPNSKRRYHDISLSIAGEPTGLAIKSLRLHETDVQERRLDISGRLALDKARPTHLDLAFVSKDWLVFGNDKLGMPDAPRATASFDIGVAVDLTKPVLDVDATVKSLAFLSPDRLERGHYFEKASVAGDIIYVDGKTRAGKLPVPPPPPAPKHRRPIDVHVHIPNPIHVQQAPLDLVTRGDLTVTIRDEGVKTRGTLTVMSGKVNLFGFDHRLTSGTVTFDDAHPKGELALEFERVLPNIARRNLSTTAGTADITFTGSPTKPKVTLHGAANDAMLEVMAMYTAGRPINVTRPGLPASSTAQNLNPDQLLVLTFMASNLPHLLFLDRISAWADPYEDCYGCITNLEAEHYSGHARMRAVARPRQPGRSEGELQYDRVLIDNDRAALGVGLRAGDRLGGGLGLFFEWSSRD